jgi:hypothetical protein
VLGSPGSSLSLSIAQAPPKVTQAKPRGVQYSPPLHKNPTLQLIA